MIKNVLELIQRIRLGPQSPAGQRAVKIIGAVLFVVISVLAYRALPERTEPVQWGTLALMVVIGGPAMLLVTTAEYRELGRLCAVPLPWPKATNVTIAATAANLLPIPGSVIVRTMHLKNAGATNRGIAGSVTAFGISFVGCAGLASACALLAADQSLAAGGVAVGGVVALIASFVMVKRLSPDDALASVLRVIGVEIAVLAVIIGRLWIVLDALGANGTWISGTMLGAASVVSTAIAIFPGGLGLREGLSGVLGTTVGVDVASGVLAAGVDRVLFLIALAVITAGTTLAGSSAVVEAPTDV